MEFFEPIWKCIIQDTVTLKTGMTSFHFFDEGIENHTILNQVENEIVNFIFNQRDYLHLILSEAGIEKYFEIFKDVPTHRILGKGGGDFDLILYGPEYPYNISCFEFKRVKVKAIDNKNDKVNKLSEVDTLFNQLTERIEMGFHEVYGILIIHTDLQNRKTPNTLFRSVSDDTNNRILYKINNTKSFPNEAGLILLRFEQPTGKKNALNFKVGLLKKARSNKQKDELTKKFNDFLHSKNTTL